MVPHALGELQDPSPWSGPTRVRGGSSYFSWPTANSLEDLPRGLYICGFKSCQVIRTCDLATLSAAQFLLALKCLPPVTWSPTSSYPHSRTGLSSPSVPSSPSFPLPFSSLILLIALQETPPPASCGFSDAGSRCHCLSQLCTLLFAPAAGHRA